MFNESLTEGASGEHVIWGLLSKNDKVRSIVDVRQDKGFQEKDIDFLVESVDRQFTPIEVKTDFKAQDTGNIVYEVSTNGNMGCFEKTQAKFIYYYIPALKVVHVLGVKSLRTYLHSVKPEEVKMGDNATGFLIPISDLQKANVIKGTYKGVY
jgi:hypothetical protein